MMKCLNCKNLGWGEEYPGKNFFGWCEEVCDAPELDRERECEHFVQATNSDIIRRMSDDELAEFLAEEQLRIANIVFQTVGYGLEKQAIYARRLDWLQQPCEGE